MVLVGVQGLLTPEAAALFSQTLSRCYVQLSEPASFGGLPLNRIFRTDVDLRATVCMEGNYTATSEDFIVRMGRDHEDASGWR